MNNRKLSMAILGVIVALFANACGASGTPVPPSATPLPATETPIPPTATPEKPSLPGVSGAPVEFVSTPGIEVTGIYMITDLQQLDAPETISNTFPSGITELTFAIKLKRVPSKLGFEIYDNDGVIEIPGGVWMTATNNATGFSTISRNVKAPTGVFADGPYQTKVYINSTLIALLNWSVGE